MKRKDLPVKIKFGESTPEETVGNGDIIFDGTNKRIYAHGTAYGSDILEWDEYEYVDLGYGLKFASCNLGANDPMSVGLYFQWGDIKGGTISEKKYNWSTAPWGQSVPSMNILDSEHDAATQLWGYQWRMPTISELEMLCDSTKFFYEWTSVNDIVFGKKIISKLNGNYIFIPASGSCTDNEIDGFGEFCPLWSSELNESYPDNGLMIYLGDGIEFSYDGNRWSGVPIRPVFIG